MDKWQYGICHQNQLNTIKLNTIAWVLILLRRVTNHCVKIFEHAIYITLHVEKTCLRHFPKNSEMHVWSAYFRIWRKFWGNVTSVLDGDTFSRFDSLVETSIYDDYTVIWSWSTNNYQYDFLAMFFRTITCI